LTYFEDTQKGDFNMKTQKRIAMVGILAVFAITLVALAALSLTGCENPTNSPNPGNPTPGTTVYIAGSYGTSNGYTACYWRNGVRTDLSVPIGLAFSYASRIAVSANGDVHIIGYTSTYNYDEGTFSYNEYTYWKNGVKTNLSVPAGTTDTRHNGIAVSANGDVYITGYYGDADNIDYNATACYWKNGVRTDMPNSGVHGIAVVTQ
jgi:hypothetical protein